MDYIKEVSSEYPSCAVYLENLDRLRKEADKVPLAEFFEPKVWVESAKDAPGSLLAVDAATLTSWAAHVSFGARVRMRSLEDAFFEELLQKRLFPAMAMVRAHMETAAFATYGLERVGQCAINGKWEEMATIIPQMLFGTSYKLEKKAVAMQHLMELSAQEPVRIMKMIEALDRFVEQTDQPKTHWYRIMYAILCDYTHPTMRSMVPFYSIREETADGWHLKYGYQESFGKDEVAMALDMLTRCIRAGYGSALVLISWTFQDGPAGIICDKTPLGFGDWIWKNILHGPSDSTSDTGGSSV